MEKYKNSIDGWTIKYDDSAHGITKTSLNRLRNILCEVQSHTVAPIQVMTGDITCGFLFLDKFNYTAYWTGDGFRTDYNGEGGAGMNTAEYLLKLLGCWNNLNTHHQVIHFNHTDTLLNKLDDVINDANIYTFFIPNENNTPYIRK